MRKKILLASICFGLLACLHKVPPEYQSFYDLPLERQNEVFYPYL